MIRHTHHASWARLSKESPKRVLKVVIGTFRPKYQFQNATQLESWGLNALIAIYEGSATSSLMIVFQFPNFRPRPFSRFRFSEFYGRSGKRRKKEIAIQFSKRSADRKAITSPKVTSYVHTFNMCDREDLTRTENTTFKHKFHLQKRRFRQGIPLQDGAPTMIWFGTWLLVTCSTSDIFGEKVKSRAGWYVSVRQTVFQPGFGFRDLSPRFMTLSGS